MTFQTLPDDPPTSVSSTDYYDHRKIIYAQINRAVTVPKATGTASQDTANIQAAIDAAKSGTDGGMVILAPGNYAINETLEVRSVAGLKFIGSGYRSKLTWSGGSDPVIKLAHARDCIFADFQITATGAYAGIQCLRDNSPNTLAPTKNTFSKIQITSGSNGFILGGTGAVDANNDFNHFIDCVTQSYTDAGYAITHSQSYNNVFDNCHALGTGTYGLNAGAVGGSVHWNGGSMSNNQTADFRIGRSYQPHIIEFVNCENSKRFIETPSNSYSQITVKGVRWAANQLNADNQAIVTLGTNMLSLESVSIGDGASPTKDLTINLSSGTQCTVKFARIYSAASNVWSGTAPGEVSYSKKITDESEGTTVDLTTSG